MPTCNVVLTDDQDRLVETLVSEGKYPSASEVFAEGLRLIEERDAAYAIKLEALRAAAQVGWDDIDAGRYIDVPADEIEDFILSLGVRGRVPARA